MHVSEMKTPLSIIKATFSSVQQIQQTVRIAHELGREVASGKEAREIYRIGVQYDTIEETLLENGMAPNRKAGQKGVPQRNNVLSLKDFDSNSENQRITLR